MSESAVERARDDEADLALRQHVRHPVAGPGLRPCVRLDAEPEAGGEELRSVAGVADPPLHVIEPGKLGGGAVRVTDLGVR